MSSLSKELPLNLYTAGAVRELDRVAIEERHIPGFELMSRAGQAGLQLLQQRWPGARDITVVCGTGNNAGDAFILAALAHEAGYAVRIHVIDAGKEPGGDAGKAMERCRALQLPLQAPGDSFPGDTDVIVDGLLGTGLDRDLDVAWQQVITAINDNRAGVLSLDIPSGLHADSGRCMPLAVKADATVTFIALKQGLLTAAGPEHCGELYFSDLGVPVDIYAAARPTARCLEDVLIASLLPPRARDTHKGDCGHVLVIGGDYGYAGAVRMAAEAALRVGAGLVSVASRPEHALGIPLARPEIMSCALERPLDLQPLLQRADVLVIGPGLGQSSWAGELLALVLQSDRPTVVDADALNLLALEPAQASNWILTPHPGEAGRLLGRSSAAIQAQRFASAGEIQQRYGGTCVLKGAGTLIVDENAAISLCRAGNPGMASGGMGDVLSGVIAGLLAQGLCPADAARAGVLLHARAADRAAPGGERGMLAMDLVSELRTLSNPA